MKLSKRKIKISKGSIKCSKYFYLISMDWRINCITALCRTTNYYCEMKKEILNVFGFRFFLNSNCSAIIWVCFND